MLWFISVRTDALVKLRTARLNLYSIDSRAVKKQTGSLLCKAGRSYPLEQWQSQSTKFISNVVLSHKISSHKCQSKQKSAPSTFVLGTFLCCAFSYRVWAKSDSSAVVTLQRLLKPDRAQWFLGNAVERGHRISAKNARKQWNTVEDKRLSVE